MRWPRLFELKMAPSARHVSAPFFLVQAGAQPVSLVPHGEDRENRQEDDDEDENVGAAEHLLTPRVPPIRPTPVEFTDDDGEDVVLSGINRPRNFSVF